MHMRLGLFPVCKSVAIPFLCQYYFPLKNCVNGEIFTASQSECILITTAACAEPWRLAISLSYGDLLPRCDTLPESGELIRHSYTSTIL